MNKKYLKYLITLSLSIILTIITISTTNNNIFAILPQNSNTGMVNIELKLYSSDNEEIFINNGDIEIYNVKDLTIDDKTGEYMLDENTSETNYLFYGNKIILPTNICPLENINKLFNKKNTSYNININDLNTYSLAITSPKSIFSLKDYEDNIQLTEHIANQEVSLTNYSIIKDREIDIRLDEFYIVINNEELKNCIFKLS